MNENILISFFLFAAGLFSLLGSILNWDFFFNNRKARLFLTILGRTGARIFYALLGIGLSVFGVIQLFTY